MRHWKITVASLQLTTTFQVDGLNAVYEVDDRQLGLVTLRVTNTSQYTETWSGWPIVIIVGGSVFEDRLGFEHSSFDNGVGLEHLNRVERVGRLYPSGYSAESGGTFRAWYLFVLPRAVTHQRIQIGLDDELDDAVRYPVRWVSSEGTTTE